MSYSVHLTRTMFLQGSAHKPALEKSALDRRNGLVRVSQLTDCGVSNNDHIPMYLTQHLILSMMYLVECNVINKAMYMLARCSQFVQHFSIK